MVKAYKFSRKGLAKLITDRQSEKIGKWVDIGFWGIIGVLVIGGIMNSDIFIRMLMCTGVNKAVKFMMR